MAAEGCVRAVCGMRWVHALIELGNTTADEIKTLPAMARMHHKYLEALGLLEQKIDEDLAV